MLRMLTIAALCVGTQAGGQSYPAGTEITKDLTCEAAIEVGVYVTDLNLSRQFDVFLEGAGIMVDVLLPEYEYGGKNWVSRQVMKECKETPGVSLEIVMQRIASENFGGE